MKIALVNSEFPALNGNGHGGIASYTYQLANALHNLGHTIFVFIQEDTKTDFLEAGITTVIFSIKPLSFIQKILSRFGFKQNWNKQLSYGLKDAVDTVYKKTGLNILDIPEYNGLAVAFKKPLPYHLIINFRTPKIIVDKYNAITPTHNDMTLYLSLIHI